LKGGSITGMVQMVSVLLPVLEVNELIAKLFDFIDNFLTPNRFKGACIVITNPDKLAVRPNIPDIGDTNKYVGEVIPEAVKEILPVEDDNVVVMLCPFDAKPEFNAVISELPL